jgi:arginine decarboxylase
MICLLLLLELPRVASEAAIDKGTLGIADARRLLGHVETSLRQSSYLQP